MASRIMEEAIAELAKPGTTCVTVKDDVLTRSEEHGIRPILRWLRDDPKCLANAFVADKVIGKAAAMLLVYAQVSGVYAQVISDPAVDLLNEYGISFTFGHKEAFISNRDGTGMCPMESKALTCTSPEEAYALFSGLVKLA